MYTHTTDWLEDPDDRRGVYFLDRDGNWRSRGYGELARSARSIGARLRASGLGPGDVVATVVPTEYDSIARFFGVWASGATVCPLAPPMMRAAEEYVDYAAGVLRAAQPSVTLAAEDLGEVVDSALARAGLGGRSWPLAPEAGDDEHVVRGVPESTALLQFTSGSTSAPRPVAVSWGNLDANVTAIRRWLGWADGEGTASWLPMYHDLGLVGAMITTTAAQGDLFLMRPDQFIRNPRRWLEALTVPGVRRTAAPSFGYRYAAQRLAHDDLAGIDLSGTRNAIVGAEPIDVAALASFAELGRRCGFSPDAYAPAYGLAEATVFACGAGDRQAPLLIEPERDTLVFGGKVEIRADGRLGDAGPLTGRGALVGCGVPGLGIDVTIRDENGSVLPDCRVGEIAVSGPSVTRVHAPDGDDGTRVVDGLLLTGDAGFVAHDELFVLGRMGNSLKVRGRTFYMEQVEAELAVDADLPPNRYVVIGAVRMNTPEIALLVEAPAGEWVDGAVRSLHHTLTDAVGITVVSGTRGMIKRTSSGKPRRRSMWARLDAGELAGSVVFRQEAT